MRLVPKMQGRIVGGEIVFEGRNLLSLSEGQMRQVRGNRIAMIFQEPMTSLNPVYTVGNQIAEAIRVHSATKTRSHEDKNKYIIPAATVPAVPETARLGRRQHGENFSLLVPSSRARDPLRHDDRRASDSTSRQVVIAASGTSRQVWQKIKLSGKKAFAAVRPRRNGWAEAVDVLRRVGIADAEQRVWEYPHQMSGGMRQRVMIAMAVSCKPALLIADEPTTALDVTIQAQILDLLDQLQRQDKMSILLITHNLGIVAQRADDVAVMYASRIVEVADRQRLFIEPLHPYTRGLLESLPPLARLPRVFGGQGFPGKRLRAIQGVVPEPLHFPTGCKFHPRCPTGYKDKRCQTFEPKLREVRSGRYVACWYAKGYEEE
jgi:oligopeptide/dipeptide ABC transporter ATP-binding protein